MRAEMQNETQEKFNIEFIELFDPKLTSYTNVKVTCHHAGMFHASPDPPEISEPVLRS
jgi:hypothetical protein